jgi:cobalamin biosynthetic protein CobC
MFIETKIKNQAKLDLSGSVSPVCLPIPDMPASVWSDPDLLRSQFHLSAKRFFECESVLAVTGIESGISALARLFQTWYGSMRVVLAEPSYDQWDKRFRRASHVVLDWPVDMILEGEIPECDVVVIGRPVNPTSQMIDIEQIKSIAERLRKQGGWLILDEAYIDWTGEESYASFIEDSPAIVLRSMAPFTGLAGANLAFVCAPKTVCTALLNEVGTQAVSAAQWWLALQYFQAELWRDGQIEMLQNQMKRLEMLWRVKLGREQKIIRGGYFICFEHEKTSEWAIALENAGVLVRLYESEEQSIIRCGIPREQEQWDRLERAVNNL